MSRYRTTFNPATGEHIQYTVTGRESDGALVRYRWVSDPGVQPRARRSASVTQQLAAEFADQWFDVGGAAGPAIRTPLQVQVDRTR